MNLTFPIQRACSDDQATESLAAEFARFLKSHHSGPPAPVVFLLGSLGAGKTCFSRGFLKGWGGDPRDVSSPTYVLLHTYGHPPLVAHADLYRLSGEGDLLDLDLWEYPEQGVPVLIEWAERVQRPPQQNLWSVTLTPEEDEVRTIEIQLLA